MNVIGVKETVLTYQVCEVEICPRQNAYKWVSTTTAFLSKKLKITKLEKLEMLETESQLLDKKCESCKLRTFAMFLGLGFFEKFSVHMRTVCIVECIGEQVNICLCIAFCTFHKYVRNALCLPAY